MAGPYHELPRSMRRRLVTWTVLRSLLFATVLVVLYYLLPLDRPWTADTAVRLLAGLLVFVGILVWQVRKISRSGYPGVQAVEALGLIVPLYLILFASTYFLMERASAVGLHPAADPHRRLVLHGDRLLNGGFGDITAKSEAARVVLIVQVLGDLAILGAGIQVLLRAVQRGRQYKSSKHRRRRWPGRSVTAASQHQGPRPHAQRAPGGGSPTRRAS